MGLLSSILSIGYRQTVCIQELRARMVGNTMKTKSRRGKARMGRTAERISEPVRQCRSWLWLGDVVHVVAEVGFGDAAVIDHDLGGRDGYFDAAYALFPSLHQHPDALLPGGSLNDHWHLGCGMAMVLDGRCHHVVLLRLAEERPWIHRQHAEVRQAAITVYPVVEEPLQVTLGAAL